jgi:hypothetical protein
MAEGGPSHVQPQGFGTIVLPVAVLLFMKLPANVKAMLVFLGESVARGSRGN